MGIGLIPQTPAERSLMLAQILGSWAIEGQEATAEEKAIYAEWTAGTIDVATMIERVKQLAQG